MLNLLKTNWKTTVTALMGIIPYILQHFGYWPSFIPLPPIEQVWPPLLAVLGVGATAKDGNVTGGTVHQNGDQK
jgi:hypothetical protein